jgi:hypothetical protein
MKGRKQRPFKAGNDQRRITETCLHAAGKHRCRTRRQGAELTLAETGAVKIQAQRMDFGKPQQTALRLWKRPTPMIPCCITHLASCANLN